MFNEVLPWGLLILVFDVCLLPCQDIIARFGKQDALPREFFTDFVKIAQDEGRHFRLLAARLEELGSSYGALPAHDGLWDSAMATSKDLLARLAIEHCVHEVWPFIQYDHYHLFSFLFLLSFNSSIMYYCILSLARMAMLFHCRGHVFIIICDVELNFSPSREW